jgi:hypothetical protein
VCLSREFAEEVGDSELMARLARRRTSTRSRELYVILATKRIRGQQKQAERPSLSKAVINGALFRPIGREEERRGGGRHEVNTRGVTRSVNPKCSVTLTARAG